MRLFLHEIKCVMYKYDKNMQVNVILENLTNFLDNWQLTACVPYGIELYQFGS